MVAVTAVFQFIDGLFARAGLPFSRTNAALTDAGVQLRLLGTNVLRSSTAGPAAIAVLQHLLGRW